MEECKIAEALALKMQNTLLGRLNLVGYKGAAFEVFTLALSDDANTMKNDGVR